jgi:hypothetical protein
MTQNYVSVRRRKTTFTGGGQNWQEIKYGISWKYKGDWRLQPLTSIHGNNTPRRCP